jgi:hypothetical protein
VPYPTEPGVLEFELLLSRWSRRIAGETDDLTALLDPCGIALVLTGPTGVCFLYLIGFRSVHIPRFVTWGHIRKILPFVDLFLDPW